MTSQCVEMEEKPQHLYRHFDANDNLLYVGVSLSAFTRLSQHKSNSHWFDEIVRVDIQKYPNRQQVLLAEIEAIQKENPRYNLQRHSKVKEETNRINWHAQESKEDLVKRIVRYKPIYSIKDASEETLISVAKIKQAIQKGNLSAFEVGRLQRPDNKTIIKYKITGWALIDWIEQVEAGVVLL